METKYLQELALTKRSTSRFCSLHRGGYADDHRRTVALTDGRWRASNYLSVGQIDLSGNPLLKEPLKREHIKLRLVGHWGTTPGLNFIYVHLNRIIKNQNLDMIYIIGPGRGPTLVAHAYLEGTYSEVYPNVSQDQEGMRRLFKQFSLPRGIASHVAPQMPGSIHEGGGLGCALSYAFGAAFDNPNLIVAQLNGYKIGNRCFLARIPQNELQKLFEGYGYNPFLWRNGEKTAL